MLDRRVRSRRHNFSAVPWGISLIEILISIGVASIGLLGVASLIPLAQHKAMQGIQEDRKAAFGRRVFREFQVRRLGSPAIWHSFDYRPLNQGGMEAVLDMSYDTSDTVPMRAYCFDPLMFSNQSNPLNPPPQIMTFPRGIPGDNAPLIPRLTYKRYPRQSSNRNTSNGTWIDGPPNDPGPMDRLQSEFICALQDDLIVVREGPLSQPPRQEFWPGNVRRYAEGHYSWMVTLVPELSSANSDLFRLSIIVFHKRILDPNTEEHQVNVVPNPSTPPPPSPSHWGNDVRLTATGSAEWSHLQEVRTGDWIMLGPNNSGKGWDSIYRWYRVVSTDDAELTDNNSRNLTLQGADWPFALPPATPMARATLVKGVVGVYEKTVRLEKSR